VGAGAGAPSAGSANSAGSSNSGAGQGGATGSAGSQSSTGGSQSSGGQTAGGGAPPDLLPVSTCTGVDPFLSASGLNVKSGRGTGSIVALRGANLGGWLMIEPYMTPLADVPDDYTMNTLLEQRFGAATRDSLIASYEQTWMQSADFDAIAALGMNAVRVPVSYFNIQNADGSLRSDAFTRLDWAVSEAWKRCIYTILDLHGAWGSASNSASGGKIGTAELWTSEDDKARSTALWQALATHYKGNPAIAGYDVLNEPIAAATDQDRWDLQDRFYKAIRAVDPDHMIFIEAIWWLDNLPQPSQYGWTNVVYECHHYLWDKLTDVPAQKAGADAKVTDFVMHANYGVPFYLGEFNFFGNSDAWKYGAEQWDKAGISWTSWSFRASADGTGLTNSWGVFNPIDPRPAVPSISNDSAADIQAKWSHWGAAEFGPNPMLQAALAMPVLNADSYNVSAAQTLTVAAPGVLMNDHHINAGVTLQAQLAAPPLHGKVTLNPDGSFSYVPDAGFTGADMFLYTAFDGRLHAASPRPVTVRIGP
jgi:aryl-phospho-beta-D-glucosidase BglC (GH1 family)